MSAPAPTAAGRDRHRLFWGATGIAFAIRAAHVLTLPGNPLFLRPALDAAMHDQWARGLLAGTWPPAEPFFRAPGYPFFLGGLYALGRLLGLPPEGLPARLAVAFVHAFVSALGAGLAALIAERTWGRRAGWAAGLVFAALWTSIYFAGELLLETLATTLALWLVWRLLADDGDGGRQPGARSLLVTGIVAGLGAITRPPLLVLLPVIAWDLHRRRGMPWRSRGWAALAAGLFLTVSPVTAYNVWRGGDAVLIATQGGVNFWIGNNPESDGATAIAPGTRPTWQGGYEDTIAQAQQEAGRPLRPSQIDAHYMRKGLSFLVHEPGRAVSLYARKLRLLLGAGERSNNNNPYFWSKLSFVLRWPVWVGFAPVLVLATLGLFRRDAHRGRRGALLACATAYALSVLVFFINGRFRLPLLALLAVPAGAGLERVWTAARGRRWPDGVTGPAVAAALGLFSASDLLGFRESHLDADAFSRFTLGNAYADAGDMARAARAWEQALDAQRRYHLTAFGLIEEPLYTSLGRHYLATGRAHEARQLYAEWVRNNPETVAGRIALGELLLQEGRTAEAAAQFEMVLRQHPENRPAQLGAAWILRANGDGGAALRRFQALAADAEVGVGAQFGAGLCLIDMQRWAEAEAAFLEVLRRQPDYWQALGNLAGIYERTGRTGEARRAYERLLQLRPDDPQARRWLSEPGR